MYGACQSRVASKVGRFTRALFGERSTRFVQSHIARINDKKLLFQTNKLTVLKMSTYADYNDISARYDASRSAVGSHLYVGALFTKLQTPLPKLHILDAGCGTGNYARALLDAGVGKVTLLDASEGMLEKAKQKSDKFVEQKRVDFIHHALPTLPVADKSLDCVILNLVIHHLDTSGERPNFLKFVAEANRVLRPGGMLAMGVIFPNQFAKGNWSWQLAPRVGNMFMDIVPAQEEMTSILDTAGFSGTEIIVPTTALLVPAEMYFDEDGPLREDVRKATTYFDKMTPTEMAAMLDEVQDMKKAGKMVDFMREHDKQRLEVGQFSFVFSMKAN